MAKRGLYANIHAKKKRIAGGSGETMRKVGTKGAPTKANFITHTKLVKELGGEMIMMMAPYHGGVSVDHTDKKPYAHARRSTKNSSIGGVAKSKKDFGFDVTITAVTPGPVVTQFEISLAPGIKVSQIMNLNKDLARALLVESLEQV